MRRRVFWWIGTLVCYVAASGCCWILQDVRYQIRYFCHVACQRHFHGQNSLCTSMYHSLSIRLMKAMQACLKCIYPRTFVLKFSFLLTSLPFLLYDRHLYGFRHYWYDSAADTTPRFLVPRWVHCSLCPKHLFRVHQTILSNHSEFFAGLFTVPQPSGEAVIDGCHVIPFYDDKVEDVVDLLKAVYDPSYVPTLFLSTLR